MGLVRWKQIERGENFLEKVNKIEKEVKETSNPSLDGYEKPAETSAISPNDSVQEAIGKLEKAMDEKQDAGDYLASDGVAADSEKLGGAAASKYAKLASPTFTGTPKAPTPVAGTNTEQIATTAFVMGALSTLVNSAPETLDTLKELAAALGNDPNFSTTVMELIGQKLPLAGGTITGDLTVKGKLTGNLTGNADSATKVNGHTVNADVPSGAKFSDTVYTHPTTSGNKHVPSGGSSGQFLGWDSDGTAKWVNNPNTNTDTLMTQNVSTTNSSYPVLLCPTANATANQGAKTGIFGSGVKVNPSTSEVIATKFTGALTGNVTGNCSGSSGSCTGNSATATNAAKVNNHTVDADVPSGAKFTDTVYTHPTTAGNKHIPSGGSSGQILRWSADGTATWGADNNTTYSEFVKSGSGAKAGLVPSPGTTAGTTKYLREDGTWQVPPDNNTTYTAASAAPKAAGTAAVGTSAKYAREDHVHPLQTSVSGSSGSCTGNAATASKAAQLTTARTIDGVSFNGTGNITHYGTCSTAAATVQKDVACAGFVLASGAKIAVKFTITNTVANPTLNVQSTGAKPIFYRGAAIAAGYLAANRTYEFIYNGTQYELVGDLDTNSDTHWTSHLYVGASGATANAATSNGGTFLSICDNSTNRNNVKIVGSGATTVTSDANGVITIKSTDNNTTYTAASAAPKAAGTAAVGSSAKYAREDHVHPVQTTVSGNAGSASKINGKTILTVSSFDASTGTLVLTSLS